MVGFSSTLTATYDDSGNILSAKTSGTSTRQYVHDAWNRLVRVKLFRSSIPNQTIRLPDYSYNPLHWRVLAQVDTNPGGDGIDQQRAMYYSAGWQLIHEDIDNFTNCNPDASGGSPCTPTPDGVNRRAQQFWGLRYIDDPVLRRIGQGTSGWLGANDERILLLLRRKSAQLKTCLGAIQCLCRIA